MNPLKELLSDEQRLQQLLADLPKHLQEQLSIQANRARNKKYPRVDRSTPKYGNLPRSFIADQLYTFLRNVDDKRDLYSFLLMIIYGLRVGEVREAHIVPGQALVVIRNKKGASHGEERNDFMPLIPGTDVLFTYRGNRHYRHLIRSFHKAMVASGANMQYVYGKSTKGRRLHQFSSHSLRHTGSEIFFQYTNNEYKTATYLRHRQHKRIGTSAFYIHYSMNTLRQDMTSAFLPLITDFVKEL